MRWPAAAFLPGQLVWQQPPRVNGGKPSGSHFALGQPLPDLQCAGQTHAARPAAVWRNVGAPFGSAIRIRTGAASIRLRPGPLRRGPAAAPAETVPNADTANPRPQSGALRIQHVRFSRMCRTAARKYIKIAFYPK